MIITHDLAIGGLQQVVVNLCKYITKDKFKIVVLCLNEAGPFAKEIEKLGIRIILLPKNNKSPDYLAFLKVAKIIRKEKIDVIHTHNTQALIDGTIAKILTCKNSN